MDEKTDLEQKKAKYQRFKMVMQQEGWKDIMAILETSYHVCLETLKNPGTQAEEDEARGTLKFIDDFMSEINSELAFGKVAQEKYVKKFVNSQEG